ncbi:hypothetical protein JKF63_07851 [Porcisia hertigi]|uniref:Uncharacterized protein n=1 Tax=Porcisia hertigi TaxID=2761500 RepID=A0A836YIF6_9TRYP|nr:hypothetical protein JKF63_07851 [Porcisia hertigi]
MMSKAAFMIQESVRRNYLMITDVCHPTTFFVRGRLPFPQGMMAIATLFKNQCPADVYAHPYFIEKQSDPAQPSPQLHLTEESQGIMKVMSGLRYMRDDNAKLDNTMVVVTDYKVEVEGRMPCMPQATLTVPAGPTIAPAQDVSGRGAPGCHSLAGKSARSSSGLTLEQRAMLRRTVHHVARTPGGSGGSNAGLGLGGTRNSPYTASSKWSTTPSTASSVYTSVNVGEEARTAKAIHPHMASSGGTGVGAAAMLRVTPGYSTFPTPEDCATDVWMSYRYLKAAIFGRRELEETGEDNPTRRVDVSALFEKRIGGYTVVYNPIEVDERTFAELLLKLQREERVVKAIVVPTRQAWRQLQVWADIFPDAELITSGEVPLLPAVSMSPFGDSNRRASADCAIVSQQHTAKPIKSVSATPSEPSSSVATPATEWRGGCQNMGDGITGLSFPEVDLEAEMSLERQGAEEAAAKAKATAEAAVVAAPREREHGTSVRGANEDEEEEEGDTAAERSQQAMLRRQQQKLQLRQEMRAAAVRGRASSVTAASSENTRDDGGDPVDVLWRDSTFFTEKRAQAIGLREGDAWRLHILSPRTSSPTEPPTEVLRLTPSIELLRIPGDTTTEEYVMFDANSDSLACTDLYHGEYADLDPANSWMCRVWFKFMKHGDYKRTDLVPRYKWLQVLQQQSLSMIQSALDDLTRQRPIKCILSAHGTPPLDGIDAVNTLRGQWNLPPLHPTERPRSWRK